MINYKENINDPNYQPSSTKKAVLLGERHNMINSFEVNNLKPSGTTCFLSHQEKNLRKTMETRRTKDLKTSHIIRVLIEIYGPVTYENIKKTIALVKAIEDHQTIMKRINIKEPRWFYEQSLGKPNYTEPYTKEEIKNEKENSLDRQVRLLLSIFNLLFNSIDYNELLRTKNNSQSELDFLILSIESLILKAANDNCFGKYLQTFTSSIKKTYLAG